MADLGLNLTAGGGFGGFPDVIGDIIGGIGGILTTPLSQIGLGQESTVLSQLLRLGIGESAELPIGGAGVGERASAALGMGGDECSLYKQPTSAVWRAKPIVFQRSPKDGSLHFWRHVGTPREYSLDESHAKRYLRRHPRARRSAGRKRRR